VGLPFYANNTLPGEDESVGGNWRHSYEQLNNQLRGGWEASFQFLVIRATRLGRAILREVKAETDLDSEANLRLQTLNPVGRRARAVTRRIRRGLDTSGQVFLFSDTRSRPRV
jgi:hypothetical protein